MGTRWPPRISTPGGVSGSGHPAPPDTSVQFNDGGVFGGDSTFEFDKVGKVVLEPNIVVTRSIIESGVISPAQITATQNDYAPANFATASKVRVSTDAARALTGLAGGVAGRRVEFLNIGTQPLIVSNENTSSVAANRFAIGADTVIPPGASAIFWYDGTSSRWRALALQQVKTSGQIDLYVAGDAAGAIDTGPGTIALPLKTLNEAIRRCNAFDEISALFNIHMAPAPVAGYTLSEVFKQVILRDSIVVIGDGAGQGGDGFTQLLASTAAIAGSGLAAIVTGGGLGVNVFRGKTVIMLTGAAAGDRRTIRDHTDTTIVPSRNFSAAVVATDTFRIVEPAVKIAIVSTGPENLAFGVGSTGANASQYDIATPPVFDPGLIFVNLAFVPPANNAWRFASCLLIMFGCEQFGTGTQAARMSGDGSTLLMGTQWPGSTCIAPIGLSFGASTNLQWSGWGVFFKNGATFSLNTAGGFMVVGDGASIRNLGFAGETLIWIGGSSSVANALTSLVISLGAPTVRALIGSIIANVAPPVSFSNTLGTNAALDLGTGANAAPAASIYLRSAILSAPVLLRLIAPISVLLASSATLVSAGTTLGVDCGAGGQVNVIGACGLTGPAGADLSVDGNVTSSPVATLAASGQTIFNQQTAAAIRRIA